MGFSILLESMGWQGGRVGTLGSPGVLFPCRFAPAPMGDASVPTPLRPSPAFTGRFFMQPPWKPDAPDATVAFGCDFFSFSFSFSLALCLWVSFVGPVHWAKAGPGNSPLDSLPAAARPPESAVSLAQNNSTGAAVTAWWRCVWQYAARAKRPARYTSPSPQPALPRSPPRGSPPRWRPTSVRLARDPSSWFDATAIPRVWYL